MAIDIKLSGGVNFGAYLDDFDANFSSNGLGFFSDNTDYTGDEIARSSSASQDLPITDGQAMIIDSGDLGDIGYDFTSHAIGGFADSIEFGQGLSDLGGGDFATDSDILISGLGLEGSGRGNEVSQLYGVGSGDTAFIRGLLEDADINLTGSAFSDEFRSFAGNDTLDGGKGADTVYGFNGDDSILGGDGADQLFGNKNNDTLDGGKGADSLDGGNGDDLLNGGNGDDVLTGGLGKDVFQFTGANFGDDQILDFAAGKPKGEQIGFDAGVFADFDAVLAAAEDDGQGNVVITVNDDSSITLVGVLEADLHKNDFLLG